MDKKSFVLYNDQKEVIDELSDEQAGQLLKAIYEYNTTKKIILKGSLKIIFIPFKTSFDRDDEKWEKTRNARSEAGKRHTGNQHTRKKMEQNGTNGTVSVSGSDNVSVNVSDSVSVSVNNTPDTPDTVFDFCSSVFENYNESDLKKSCKKFFAYYGEKKWAGVNDWKEKVKMWIEDDIENNKIKTSKNDEYIDEAGFVHRNGRRVL